MFAVLPWERDAICRKRLTERSDRRNDVDTAARRDPFRGRNYDSSAALRVPPRFLGQIYLNNAALL